MFVLFLLHVLTAPLIGINTALLHFCSCCPSVGACIAIAYAVDRETIRQLRWSSIKVSELTKTNHINSYLSNQGHLLYRKTSEVVRSYSIDGQKEEEIGGSVKLSDQSAKYESIPYYKDES